MSINSTAVCGRRSWTVCHPLGAALGFSYLLLGLAFLRADEMATLIPDAHGFSNALSDTWSATDGLGRTVADARQAGPPQSGRVVGIFYFLASDGIPEVYDDTKILAANPTSPQWGPARSSHYWGEPFFGYYKPDDPWVIRKHAQMLSDAGVEVIVFDVTNALTYPKAYSAVCEVYDEMRGQGCQTPRIAFMLNAGTAATAQKLYDDLYGAGHFPDLWFRWLGKPLILANPDELPPKLREFFTVRRSWAWTHPDGWFGDGKDKWPWLDNSPQNYGWHDDKTVPEEIAVAVAQHPTTNIGRSYHAGHEPPEAQQDSGRGVYFEEQFKRALDVKPEFVFITGWNEWTATRFLCNADGAVGFTGRSLKKGESYWVDEYNQEFSRDIEPQRGHYEDNYYYQMVSFIREYKGVRPSPKPTAAKTVRSFSDWKDVGPEYLDDAGDTDARNHPGNGEATVYVSNEGHNDIVRAKVARDESTVWFYAETRQTLTSRDGKNWMQLLINSDGKADTGWFGYDYVVNRQPGDPAGAVLERYDDAKKAWTDPVRVPIWVNDNQLYVGIPRQKVGGFGGPLNFEFKWADNVPLDVLKSPVEFLEHGDVAPNARFNYVFSERDP